MCRSPAVSNAISSFITMTNIGRQLLSACLCVSLTEFIGGVGHCVVLTGGCGHTTKWHCPYTFSKTFIDSCHPGVYFCKMNCRCGDVTRYFAVCGPVAILYIALGTCCWCDLVQLWYIYASLAVVCSCL